jgi:hypothetical protein
VTDRVEPTEDGALALLRHIAEDIQKDYVSTFPHDDNPEYDLYVERGVYPEAGHQLWGVIDMGDNGIWCYQLVEQDRYDGWEWVDVTGAFDPHDVKLRIVSMRTGQRPD